MPRSAKVQPQSGSRHRAAPGDPSHEDKALAQQPAPSVHPIEAEDAYLTGASRSLQRRVLGLNVASPMNSAAPGEPGGQAQPHPEQVAGQHATGSSTTGNSGRNGR